MKRSIYMFLGILVLYNGFLFSDEKNISDSIKEDIPEVTYKEEAKWHYNMALDLLKEKENIENNKKEAIRIFDEIINCYDASYVEAYARLWQLYKETNDPKAGEIEIRYKQALEAASKTAKEEEKENYSSDEPMNKLIKDLGSEDYETRIKASEEILKNGEKAREALFHSLNSKNIYRACYSAVILGKLKDKASIQPLIETFTSGRPSLISAAINSLGEIGDPSAIPGIINQLSSEYFNHYEGRYKIRDKAVEVLSGSFKNSSVDFLIKAAEDSRTKWYALETLSRIKPLPDKSTGIFLTALNDQDEKVRLVAVTTLLTLKDKKLNEELINLLDDKNPQVRYAVISAIGTFEAKVDIKAELINALSDPDKMVAGKAVELLGKYKLSDVKEILLGIASDKTKDVVLRWYAVRALGENFKKFDISKLKELLEDKDIWISSAAAAALDKGRMTRDQRASGIMEKRRESLDNLAINLSQSSGRIFNESKEASARKGIRFLLSQQEQDGSFKSAYFPVGNTQLVLLVLLKQGWNEDDEVVKRAMKFMLKHEQEDGSYLSTNEIEKEKVSYLTGLAIRVLAAPGNKKYKEKVKKSVEFLISIQDKSGGFGYYKGTRLDLSASENAIFGLAAGYEFLGMPATDETWMKVADYIKNHQNEDGGFGYGEDEELHRLSFGSMTAIGLTLQMTLKKAASSEEVKKALNWLSQNYMLAENPKAWEDKHYPYYLKALATAMVMTGSETLTDKDNKVHDVFKEIAEKLMKEQKDDGSWQAKWYEPGLATAFYISVLQLKTLNETLMDIY